ncbi:MAG: Uma2 family endonuclease [Acidobacteria bacterium]|nr:Uma2 family endonuclease [Acidobacteriota bacterium]
MSVKTLITVEELAHLPDDGRRYELDERELITMAPASEGHGGLAAEVLGVLRNYVKEHSLGRVFSSDTGFRLADDTVRAPDVAFVRKERLTGRWMFFQGAPDLAVEVFSPTDSVAQLMRKVQQYLRAGCHTVWVVYPETRQVHVLEASGSDRILEAADQLEAPELLPGFAVTVAALFE